MSSRGDEYRTQARQLAKRLAAYEGGVLQIAQAARELALLEPERGALVLASLLELAREGERPSRLGLESVSRAVLGPTTDVLSKLHRKRLREAAAELELEAVVALFMAPPPVLAVDPDNPPKPDPKIAHLTLGHKKMLARTAHPDLLARLAAEAEPSVVQNILVNPRLSESMVVRICARRPIRAEVLRAVYASRKWGVREQVRLAMVQNPFCEPELALKLLPSLPDQALRSIARNQVLQLDLRTAAARLLNRPRRPSDEQA